MKTKKKKKAKVGTGEKMTERPEPTKRGPYSPQNVGRGSKRIVSGNKTAMATRCLAGSLPLISASTAATAAAVAARAQPLPSAAAPRRVPTRLSVATNGEQQLITAQDPAHGESLLLLAVACSHLLYKMLNPVQLIMRQGMETLSLHG